MQPQQDQQPAVVYVPVHEAHRNRVPGGQTAVNVVLIGLLLANLIATLYIAAVVYDVTHPFG